MLFSRRSIAIRLLLISTLAVMLGCGGDSTTTPEDGGGNEARTLAISLGASSGSPGSRVTISGIPDDVDFVYALVIVPGPVPVGDAHAIADGDTGVALVRRTDAGDELVVPLHPTFPMLGGTVEVEVTDGENISSNRVTLDVAALPQAPGAFDALVTNLETLFDKWAAQQGKTMEEIRALPAVQMSPFEMPLFLLDAIVANPDNPNSLRAFADGDIPLAEGVTIDREVLDGIAAISGLGTYVDDKNAFIDTLTVPDTTQQAFPGLAMPTSGASAACIEPPTFDIGTGNCDKLAEVMTYQSELALEKAGAVEKLQNDAIDATTTVLSYATGGIIAWGITNTFWAADNIAAGSIGIYPSAFVSDETDFKADPEEFDEDFTSKGHWSEFKVTAVSEGWRFDKVILDGLKKAKGLENSGWDDVKLQNFFDAAQKKTYMDYVDKMKKNVQNDVYKKAKQDLGIDDITKLEYCPQTWTGIDCTGLPYSSGSSNSLKYDSEQLSYEPTEVGSANLLVETMPIFGPGNATGETKIIRTNRLEVFIDPFQATMDVSEEKDFVARVANAEDETIEWSIVGATKTDSPPLTTKVKSPPLPWQTPIELTAKSKSNTGLRKDKVDSDPRTKTVYITYQGPGPTIEIDPPYKCIAPGDKLQFTPHVTGLEEGTYTVIWKKVDGYGSIDQNGLYQSLSIGSSSAKISAEIEGVENVIDYARVDVRECNCYFSIGIVGPASWNTEGADVAYTVGDFGGNFIYQFFFEPEDNTNNVIGVSIADTETKLAPRPGDPPGTWLVNFSFSTGTQTWSAGQGDGDGAVYLNLDEITENSMQGTLSGIAVQYDQKGGIASTCSVYIPFRAGRFLLGGAWPCN